MKHILNNLSEQEKNAIREQHTGGMNVVTENFHKLLGSKLGDSKPLVNEQSQTGNDRISNLAGIMRTIQTKQVPQQVIVNPSSRVNNMSWNDYVTKFKITPQEIDQANALLTKMGQTSPIKGSTPSTPTNQPAPYGSLTSDLPSVTVVGKKPKKPGVRPTAGVPQGSNFQNQ